jgi:formylglycine-generating enzyme required for sulfatase activity
LAIQEIEETYAQEKLAKAEQLSWNKLQKEYAVQAPGEEGDAQKFVALAVEQQVRGQLKLARENWLGAQTQWQSAHQTVAKQIAAIDQQREDRRAEAVRAQRIAEAESARKTRNEAAWAKAKHSNTLAAYEEYLQSHENKDYTEQANNRVDQIYKQINPIVNQLLEGMISIPSGSFMMGSNDGPSEERPVHLVEIRAFKLGATEVTFQQWDACVSAGFCRELDDRGWGKGDRPAINVSYNDITQQFIPWLNKTTGKTFRLPSEAEWEYAARAGTTTPFSTGQCITPGQANFSYDEKYDSFLARMGCDALAKHSRHKTIVAKSFSPNAFGLYDMHGNVTEWTQDCFNLRYNGAPKDGSAWLLGKCKDRMVRGGAWNNGPLYLRSTHRDSLPVTFNYNSFVGFRLAQDP